MNIPLNIIDVPNTPYYSVCPEELSSYFNPVPYSTVLDSDIKNFLESNEFINTLLEPHSISENSRTDKHHALRIASLIKLILKKIDIYPITVYTNSDLTYPDIEDGFHRLRSFLYIKKFIDPTIRQLILLVAD